MKETPNSWIIQLDPYDRSQTEERRKREVEVFQSSTSDYVQIAIEYMRCIILDLHMPLITMSLFQNTSLNH